MPKLREVTFKECDRILRKNGFEVNRISGGHVIYKNNHGRHVSLPRKTVNACVWQRLVKENCLDEKLK